MSRPSKKAVVDKEKRKEWLRRNEEGETPPQIAKKDQYDVRTVRKQLETARQERETQVARATVLRNALEKHYEDLQVYVAYLDSQIFEPNTKPIKDAELLEKAMHQHLPHWLVWNYVSRIRELKQQYTEQSLKNLRVNLEGELKAYPIIIRLKKEGFTGLERAIITALVAQAKSWSQGSLGLNLDDNFSAEADNSGSIVIRRGSEVIGKTDDKHVDEYLTNIKEVLHEFESHLKERSEYHELEETYSEIGRVQGKLKEELAVVRLKHLVPGHCKFCPL